MRLIFTLVILLAAFTNVYSIEQILQVGGGFKCLRTNPVNSEVIYVTMNQCMATFNTETGEQNDVWPLQSLNPYDCAVSHDGSMIAVINIKDDNYLVSVMTSSGELISNIQTADYPQNPVIFDTDGNVWVRHTMKMVKYNSVTTEEIETCSFENGWVISSMATDGSKIAVRNYSKFRIKDLRENDSITFDTEAASVVGSYFSPDASLIATHNYDSTLRIFNTVTGSEVLRIDDNNTKELGESAGCISEDNKTLAYCTIEGIYIVDIQSGNIRQIRYGDFSSNALAFDNNPDYIWAISSEKINKINLNNGNKVFAIDGNFDIRQNSSFEFLYSFVPGNKQIITASKGLIAYRDIENAGLLKEFTGIHANLSFLGYNHDGSSIITVDLATPRVKVWNSKTGIQESFMSAFTNGIGHVCLGPKKNTILIESAYENIRYVDLENKRLLTELENTANWDYNIKITADEKYAYSRDNYSVYIWDLSSGKLDRTFTYDTSLYSVDIFPDGNNILLGRYNGFVIADAQTGEKGKSVIANCKQAGMSPDGSLIYFYYDDSYIKVYSYPELTEVLTIDPDKDVQEVHISRDNSKLAYEIAGKLNIIDIHSGNTIKNISAAFYDFEFSPDCSEISYYNGKDIIVEKLNGQIESGIYNFPGGDAPDIIRWLPDGERYAAADGKILKIIDTTTQSVLKEVELSRKILDINISENGNYLAAGIEYPSDKRHVYLWKIEDEKGHYLMDEEFETLDYKGAHTRFINDDEELLVVGENVFSIWNVSTRSLKYKKSNGNFNEVFDYDKNNNMIAVATLEDFEIWDLNTQTRYEKGEITGSNNIWGIAWSENGEKLYLMADDYKLYIYNFNDKKLEPDTKIFDNKPSMLTISDNHEIICLYSNYYSAIFLNSNNLSEIAEHPSFGFGHVSRVDDKNMTYQIKRNDGTLETKPIIEAYEPMAINAPIAGVSDISFRSGAEYIVGREKSSVNLYDVYTANIMKRIQMETGDNLWLHPSGNILISGRKIYNIETETSRDFGDEQDEFVGMSPDGRYAVISTWDGYEFYNPETGELDFIIDDDYSFNHRKGAFAISPDNKYMAAKVEDNIKIWDIDSRQFFRSLPGGAWGLDAPCFHPASKFIASTSFDGYIRFWNIQSGDEVEVVECKTPSDLVFSDDGLMMMSGDIYHGLKVWNLDPDIYLSAEDKEGTSENTISITPNPVGANTEIKYLHGQDTYFGIQIHDIHGNIVKEVQHFTFRTSGEYSFNVDLDGLPSGMYYCVIKTNSGSISAPIAIVK